MLKNILFLGDWKLGKGERGLKLLYTAGYSINGIMIWT